MVNSRNKGAAGERELANYLKEKGFPASRGQQHAGGSDSPDVRCDALSFLHPEVKRTERFRLYPALEQAINDAGEGQTPVVIHRQNGKGWVAVLRLDDFLELFSWLK